MTDTTKERPGISERYILATGSSNLRVVERSMGDVDLLIAAGYSDSLGVMLFRLMGEYQTVAADIKRTAANDQTAVALILMHLKSLRETKDAVGRHAIAMATRWEFMENDRAVLSLTGRALRAFLDPLCHKCNGSKHIGAYGASLRVCRACSGTGLAKDGLGETPAERYFIGRLLADMDRRVADANNALHKLTSGR